MCGQRKTRGVRKSCPGFKAQEKDRLGVFEGRAEKNGKGAVGVCAPGDEGSRGLFDAQALGANGDAAVGNDAGLGALAENVGPPGALCCGTQDGAALCYCKVSGDPGRGSDFTVDFLAVAVVAQGVDQGVGLGEGGDVFGGKDRGEAVLPVAVGAFDFAFGLWCGGVAQGDLVEAEGGAELGEGLVGAGEEEGVVVDIECQRQAKALEGA